MKCSKCPVNNNSHSCEGEKEPGICAIPGHQGILAKLGLRYDQSPESAQAQLAGANPEEAARARRASKPRIPLGQPHCPECQSKQREAQ
jgi:hypothetical protein